MQQKTKSTLKRFLKVLAGAFVGQAVLIAPSNYDNLEAYAMAVLTSGIAGILLALQKYLSWKDYD